MAYTVGLYSGGTTGARDGTLISSGDTEVTPLVFSALNTVVTAHFRAIESTTGDDPGQDSVGNVAFTCPDHVKVCATSGGTYEDTVTLSVKATGGNQPIYFKQTASAHTATEGNITIGAVEWTAGTRVAQVGTVTPTAGASSVSLAWSAVTGAAGYEVRRATNSGMSANLIVLTTSCATNAYTNNSAGGNAPSNGTAYYYQVRAYAATGAGSWSAASASATPQSTPVADVTNFVAAPSTSSDTTVALSWTNVTDNTGYLIEWGTDGVTYGSTLTDPGANATSTTHTGRTTGTRYYYRIKAKGAENSVNYATSMSAPQWNFGASNGTAPDSGHFTLTTSSSNTCACDGSGNLAFVRGSTSGSLNAQVSSVTKGSGTRTLYGKFRFTPGSGSPGFYPIDVINSGVGQYMTSWIRASDGLFYVNGTNSSSQNIQWKKDGSGTTSASVNTTSDYAITLSSSTDYVIRLDITTTTIRQRLMSSDMATTHFDTGAIAFTSMKSCTTMDIYVGNTDTSCTGTLKFDYIYDTA